MSKNTNSYKEFNPYALNQSFTSFGMFADMQSYRNFISYIKNGKISKLGELFQTRTDYILGLTIYPFPVLKFVDRTFAFSGLLRIGQIDVDNVNMSPKWNGSIGNQTEPRRIGTFVIEKHFNNFMDYEPYTHIQLYLPFMSFIDLPVNEIMGKTISVKYGIDFTTNTAIAYICNDDDDYVITTVTGRIGRDMPLGATNNEELTKSIINSSISFVGGVASIGIGVATGGVGGALLGTKGISLLTQTAQNVVNTQVRYQRGSIPSTSSASGYSPSTCYMIITRPKPIEIDDDYSRTKGKPLGEYRTLSTMKGFTVIDDIHLEGFENVTENEISEIERLLKSGVIF